MKNWIVTILLFVFSLILYAFTLKGVYGNINSQLIKNNLDQATKPLELSPERGRFILTMSLAKDWSFSLSPELADAASPDVGYHEGKFYIFFPPGISMLAVPFYLVGEKFNVSQLASFAMISLFAALNMVLIFLIARNVLRLPLWASAVSGLIFSFGSTSWSYAVTLYQHHVTLFLILSSFYAAWKYKQGHKYIIFYSLYIWLSYGFGIWLDYPNALLLAPIMAYHLLSLARIQKLKSRYKMNFNFSVFAGAILFFLIIGLHGYYNQLHFGSFKRVSGGITSWKEYQREKSQKEKGLPVAESKERNIVGFFKEEYLPHGFSILMASRDRSLFLYAPVFILGLVGIFFSLKKFNWEKVFLIAIVVANVFLYSSWGDPWGGWAFGPRYLIPSMAVLALFTGVFATYVKNSISGLIAVFTLFAYSSFIGLLGVLTTNQVPPKVEADFLKMKYNFLLNWDYLVSGSSGSFLYNAFAAKYINLQLYFLLIYLSLVISMFVLLFVIPMISLKLKTKK